MLFGYIYEEYAGLASCVEVWRVANHLELEASFAINPAYRRHIA